jgi:hypothetical protein
VFGVYSTSCSLTWRVVLSDVHAIVREKTREFFPREFLHDLFFLNCFSLNSLASHGIVSRRSASTAISIQGTIGPYLRNAKIHYGDSYLRIRNESGHTDTCFDICPDMTQGLSLTIGNFI